MKTFNVPGYEEVTPANQNLFDTLKKNVGKVPNLYATMAYSQNALGIYLAFTSAKTSLKAKEKEAVSLVISQVNNCAYCSSSHTVTGKLNGFSDEQILQLRKGYADFDAKLDALVKFAKSVAENNGNAEQQTIDNFYAAGYTTENLIDSLLAITDRIFTNYLYAITKIPIDFPIAPVI